MADEPISGSKVRVFVDFLAEHLFPPMPPPVVSPRPGQVHAFVSLAVFVGAGVNESEQLVGGLRDEPWLLTVSDVLMNALFSPIALRSVVLPNRVLVSPMCQYSSEDGEANAWHLMHLGSLACSGAGMLCIEATAVEPVGRITRPPGLWDDRTEAR